jgi:hypothetical protein
LDGACGDPRGARGTGDRSGATLSLQALHRLRVDFERALRLENEARAARVALERTAQSKRDEVARKLRKLRDAERRYAKKRRAIEERLIRSWDS